VAPGVLYNRDVCYRFKGEFDKAISDHTKVIQYDPDFAPAYNQRGLCHQAKGDAARSKADLDQAAKFDPSLKPK
jgi:tetratricopeptide (TPR) repeat protein